MAKKRQELKPNKNGVYERNPGKRLTRLNRTDETGAEWEEPKFVRPKFRLGKDETKANIVPAFEDEYQEVTKREIKKIIRVKESLEQATGVSISSTTSETLHNALDDYIQHIRTTCLTAAIEGED